MDYKYEPRRILDFIQRGETVKMHRVFFILILSSFFFLLSSAQNRNIDSLLTLLKTDKEDTSKVIHLNQLTWECMLTGDFEKGLNYGNEALQLALKLNFKKGIANASGNVGNIYSAQGDYRKALDYYLKALKIDEVLFNSSPDGGGRVRAKKGIASRLGNIGIVYHQQGDYPKALDYYFKALKMKEELGNKNEITITLGNIGNVYLNQGDYPKALDYYFKALKMAEELGDKNKFSIVLGNIGIVYNSQADYPKARDYYFKALKFAEELGDKNSAAAILGNIGNVYDNQADYPKALDYYFKALKIHEELGDKNGIVTVFGNIGLVYIETGKYKEAEKYLLDALRMTQEIGAQDYERQVEESLSTLYEKIGRFNLALEHYKKEMVLKDTLFSEEKNKEITRKEMNYEFEKKEAAAKAEADKQAAVAEAEKKKQQVILWSVVSGLLIVVVFAGFIFRALRITQKQKRVIETQKKVVEEKQSEILASIRYAKRIQDAILPTEKYIDKTLKRLKAKIPSND